MFDQVMKPHHEMLNIHLKSKTGMNFSLNATMTVFKLSVTFLCGKYGKNVSVGSDARH